MAYLPSPAPANNFNPVPPPVGPLGGFKGKRSSFLNFVSTFGRMLKVNNFDLNDINQIKSKISHQTLWIFLELEFRILKGWVFNIARKSQNILKKNVFEISNVSLPWIFSISKWSPIILPFQLMIFYLCHLTV